MMDSCTIANSTKNASKFTAPLHTIYFLPNTLQYKSENTPEIWIAVRLPIAQAIALRSGYVRVQAQLRENIEAKRAIQGAYLNI